MNLAGGTLTNSDHSKWLYGKISDVVYLFLTVNFKNNLVHYLYNNNKIKYSTKIVAEIY